MRYFMALISAGLLLIAGVPPAGAVVQGATVRTDKGTVQGATDAGVSSFKGIPYAAPPTGARRWLEPQPAESWEGARSAVEFGQACIQNTELAKAIGVAPLSFSEDCLYLNVWTSKLDADARLPVIVWIHGGGFVLGSGAQAVYDGTPMAKKGVVFVSFNYRLGALGFFSHPALEKQRPRGPVNFGLLDQVAALKWVRANIRRFGGDPENVTIMGQSAGGQSVLAHFASPLSRGLFHKGVALSSYLMPDANREKAVAVGARIGNLVGLEIPSDIDELRAISAARFVGLDDKEARLGPVPVAGDEMLPKSISDTFAAREEARVPLIVATTSADSSVAWAFGVEPKAILDRFGAGGRALRPLYPGVSSDDEFASQVLRDVFFTMSARQTAHRHARHAPTWRAYFDFVPSAYRSAWSLGVPHAGEIAYYLDTAHRDSAAAGKLTLRDRAMARTVSSYIVSFAKRGVPMGRGGPTWDRDRRSRDRTLIFGRAKIEQRVNFMRPRLDAIAGATGLAAVFARR